MKIDFQEISPRERYKLLSSTVIPRPIALVSTRGIDGVDNAAPYSFFNVFSEDPPILILGLQNKDDGAPKDTARNILDTSEFVVNLIDRKMAEAMNNCAVDFPPEISEFDVKLLEKKINSGYKRIFSESEEKYNLYVKLNLIFIDKVNDEIRTSVSGNIDFLINDKMSLIERKITVFMSLEKLIFQIDKTFNKILLRKKFNKYIKL